MTETPRFTPDALSPSDEPDSTDESPSVRRRYLGKYRGTVRVNEDPLGKGRLMVECPDVYGMFPSTWAMPCLPMASIATGMFVKPPLGSGVWVEFENGDPNRPIWVGGYWTVPQSTPMVSKLSLTTPPTNPVVTFETLTSSLSLSDTPLGMFGTACLRSGASSITFNPDGIVIVAPSVSIVTPSFSVNRVALTVGV